MNNETKEQAFEAAIEEEQRDQSRDESPDKTEPEAPDETVEEAPITTPDPGPDDEAPEEDEQAAVTPHIGMAILYQASGGAENGIAGETDLAAIVTNVRESGRIDLTGFPNGQPQINARNVRYNSDKLAGTWMQC